MSLEVCTVSRTMHSLSLNIKVVWHQRCTDEREPSAEPPLHNAGIKENTSSHYSPAHTTHNTPHTTQYTIHTGCSLQLHSLSSRFPFKASIKSFLLRRSEHAHRQLNLDLFIIIIRTVFMWNIERQPTVNTSSIAGQHLYCTALALFSY